MLHKGKPVSEGSSESPKGAKGAAFFICTLRHPSCSLRDVANVRRNPDTLRALSQWTYMAAQSANKSLTAVYRQLYSDRVADKDATGFDSPTKKADTRQQAVFFCPNHAAPSMERRWWGGFGLPVPSFRSVNPTICRSTPFDSGTSGSIPLKKEAIMPGTRTFQQNSNDHSNSLSVDHLYNKAFSSTRDPRSTEYKAGVRAALAYRIDGARIPQPYGAGTAQDDAYHAGQLEGHAIWRAATSAAGGTAVSVTTTDVRAGASQSGPDMMNELAGLCEAMEYLRSWFGAHEDLLRAVPGTNVCRVYDRFVEGVCRARTIARVAGIVIDTPRIKAHDWNARPFAATAPVGPAAPLRYVGGDLGMTAAGNTIIYMTEGGDQDRCDIEFALQNADRFAEPGRARLLIDIAVHFGLPFDALLGQDNGQATEGGSHV